MKRISGNEPILEEELINRPTIVYTAEAYGKMTMLIHHFSTEVAWHGFVKKVEGQPVYVVYDIVVYPQIVTGMTVDTDDDDYAHFLIDLPFDQATHLRMQCHSHVNMGVSPSGTDLRNQREIVESSGQKGFYIFQIWNKRMECATSFYDFDNNILWEKNDLSVFVAGDEDYLDDWLDEAVQQVAYKGITPETEDKTLQEIQMHFETQYQQERMDLNGSGEIL